MSPELLSLIALVIALTSTVINYLVLRLQRDPEAKCEGQVSHRGISNLRPCALGKKEDATMRDLTPMPREFAACDGWRYTPKRAWCTYVSNKIESFYRS